VCALVGFYTVLNGSSLSTFWDSVSVRSSRVKKSKKKKAGKKICSLYRGGVHGDCY
jgi:hypothetical protein